MQFESGSSSNVALSNFGLASPRLASVGSTNVELSNFGLDFQVWAVGLKVVSFVFIYTSHC